MSTTPALPAATRELSLADYKAELVTTAREVLAPMVAKEMEPFTKAQADVASHLTLLTRNADTTPEHVRLDKGLGAYPIGRKLRALAMAALEGKTTYLDPDRAIHAIKAATGSPDRGLWPAYVAEPTIKWLEYVKATLLMGTPSAAGDMVFPQQDEEWIQLLRNNTTVRGIARTLPMPRGSTQRRRQLTAGTAAYQGETGKIALSNQTVDRVTLSYKKLTAGTVVGNDLIRFSRGEADRLVQDDLLAVTGLREDQAFLVGDGTSNTPKGILGWTLAANKFARAGVSLGNYQADLTKAIRLVQAANVNVTPANSYFIMSVSQFWGIYALITTTGDWVFAQGLNQTPPRLFGFPVLLTTQLEVSNAWIGVAGGMIFFVHAPSLEIHDSMARTAMVHPFGAYFDGTVVQSGISNDETVITVIGEHDFFQVYDVAAAVITGYAT